MPFSLSSYLLGVGTIVGALALGVGSGTLVTKKAVKETAAPTRAERVARAEQAGAIASQATATRDDPAPPAEPSPAVRSDAVAATAATEETPKADIRREAEGAKEPAPAKPARQRAGIEGRRAEENDGAQGRTAETICGTQDQTNGGQQNEAAAVVGVGGPAGRVAGSLGFVGLRVQPRRAALRSIQDVQPAALRTFGGSRRLTVLALRGV